MIWKHTWFCAEKSALISLNWRATAVKLLASIGNDTDIVRRFSMDWRSADDDDDGAAKDAERWQELRWRRSFRAIFRIISRAITALSGTTSGREFVRCTEESTLQFAASLFDWKESCTVSVQNEKHELLENIL